jgi:anti-sigma factor RsiW
MDTEKIESLLMDHALGATSADVAALIEAYIAKDDAARAKLEEWRQLAGSAKLALRADPMILPAFPRQALQRSQRRKVFRLAAWGAGMAACVALGFALGSLRNGGGEGTQSVVAQMSNQVTEQMTPARVAAVRDFWSVSRLREYARNAQKPAADADASWWSILQPPVRIGG